MNKLNLDYFADYIRDNDVFAFEINREDYHFLSNKLGLIAESDGVSFIVGKPIRIKRYGEVKAILNDFCTCCNRDYTND